MSNIQQTLKEVEEVNEGYDTAKSFYLDNADMYEVYQDLSNQKQSKAFLRGFTLFCREKFNKDFNKSTNRKP